MSNLIIKHKYTILLILILCIGLFLRVRLSQDKCLHKWDERFHALVAKNIIKHPLKPTLYEDPVLKYDYKKWYANYVWLHKPPLPLWLIATSYKALGVSEFTTRLPSILLSTLAIFITFLLGKHFFSKKVGLLAAFFFSINGLLIELVSGRVTTDHYDTLFLVFIEIAILFAYYNSIRGKIIYAVLTGLFLGLALLTKWLPALIVLPIHFLFLMDKAYSKTHLLKNLGIAATIAALLSIPWQVFISNQYPLESSWESHYNWLHFVKELEGHIDDQGFFYFLNRLRINYSEIIYIPLLYFLYKLKTNYKDYKLWALFVWIFIPLLIFSFAKMKLQGYILFTCPALFIVTAYFFFELKDKYLKQSIAKSVRVVYIILLIAMIILPVRYCFERTSFGLEKPKHEKYIDDYKEFIGKLPKKSLVLNVQYPIEFMFYNDCIAYTMNELEVDEILRIKKLGYKIFFYDENQKTIELF